MAVVAVAQPDVCMWLAIRPGIIVCSTRDFVDIPLNAKGHSQGGNFPVSKAASVEERPLLRHHRPGRSSEPEPKPPNRQPDVKRWGHYQAQQDVL